MFNNKKIHILVNKMAKRFNVSQCIFQGTVDKRKLLRQILSLLLEDLKYQDLYSEFDEILRETECQSESELPINSAATTSK